MDLHTLKHKIVNNKLIRREEVEVLLQTDLDQLCQAADDIRRHFQGTQFDICTIVNAKSGRCSEDCSYCAQSRHYQQDSVPSFDLLSTAELVADAKRQAEQGVLRYSIVTSGRRLPKADIERVAEAIRAIIRSVDIQVCVSLGLLDQSDFEKLKAAGASRFHCNLETSERFFPQICRSHSFSDKLDTLKAARAAGLDICSGGIIGLGESMPDRIDMLFQLRALGVHSVPINLLNPIPGTPLEHQPILDYSELRRVIALARFILPTAWIRLAGGRSLLPDRGEAAFRSGANAVITGDMLTTSGITPTRDIAMLETLGFTLEAKHE